MRGPFRRKTTPEGDVERVLNPFIESQNDPEFLAERIVEIDFEVKPGRCGSASAYMRAVEAGALKFPWFHEMPFGAAEDISYALKHGTMPGIRRVLLAFLGGRPMSSVAKRVQTSRSRVYRVIKNLYIGTDIEEVVMLGLAIPWDIPKYELDDYSLPGDIWIGIEGVPVICSLCHRVTGHIELLERFYNSTLVFDPRDRMVEQDREGIKIVGHALSHFPLHRDPFPNRRGVEIEMKSGRDRNQARRWSDLIDPAITGYIFGDSWQLRPVVEGRSPTDIELRRFYRGLLDDSSKL